MKHKLPPFRWRLFYWLGVTLFTAGLIISAALTWNLYVQFGGARRSQEKEKISANVDEFRKRISDDGISDGEMDALSELYRGYKTEQRLTRFVLLHSAAIGASLFLSLAGVTTSLWSKVKTQELILSEL